MHTPSASRCRKSLVAAYKLACISVRTTYVGRVSSNRSGHIARFKWLPAPLMKYRARRKRVNAEQLHVCVNACQRLHFATQRIQTSMGIWVLAPLPLQCGSYSAGAVSVQIARGGMLSGNRTSHCRNMVLLYPSAWSYISVRNIPWLVI